MNLSRIIFVMGALILFAGLTCPQLTFAAPKIVHKGGNWISSVLQTKKGKICFVHGEPSKSSGKYKRRGRTYLQVTHRPKEKILDEFSITAGYPYKKESEITAEIDGQKRKLFTSGGSAWSYSAKEDRALVKAMRGGRQLVIRGVSALGTVTTDRYSLMGFTTAYIASKNACGVK
jgi:hypothetical protein